MVCIIVLGCLVQGVWANTAAQIANIINTATAGNNLTVSVDGNTVTVTGTLGITPSTSNFLTFGINSGVTVVWQASLSGNPNTNFALININGGTGTFRMESGTIANTGTGRAITNGSTSAVNIQGGTVSATSGVAIHNASTGVITISGTSTRITSANTSSSSGTIFLANSGTEFVNRLIINGGTVENTVNNGNAIYNNSVGTVRVAGGTVSATTGSAIRLISIGMTPAGGSFGSYSGSVNISNGTVRTETGTTISGGNQTVSGGGLTISGGTVSTTTGTAISTGKSSGFTISGGTVSATTGRAIHYSGGGTVTISGSATRVTSANTSATSGTIRFENSNSGATLTINGGTVENTATGTSGGHTIYMDEWRSNTVNVSGGTVRSVSGDAVHNRNVSGSNLSVNISGSGTVTASGSNRRAVYVEVGSVRITGGTVSATQSNGWAVHTGSNVTTTLGRNPTITGRIYTHADMLSVLTTGTDAFAPVADRVYTLEFPTYPIGRVAVMSGSSFLRNFVLQSSEWALTVAGAHLAIAQARIVTFDLNGGCCTTPAPISVAQGNTVHTKPPTTGFTRTGFTNDGNWYTTSAGTTEFLFGDGGTPVMGNITLFLRWTPIVYTITYNLNGGTNHALNPANYTTTITLQTPTREGYTFDGWYGNSNFTGSRITFISHGSTGNITLWARWNYTVTYNINGGTGVTPSSLPVPDRSSITLASETGFLRSGFAFAGWNTESNGTGINRDAGMSFTPTDHTTLYAIWIPAYTITYNINGGTGTIPAARAVAIGHSITLANGSGLTRDGFIFDGWNTEPDGTGTTHNAGISFTPTGDITLYVNWTPTYTVTYNINGGTGTTPSVQTVIIGNNITLVGTSGFSRSGFTFGGWNTESDGTGTNYDALFSLMPTNNIILYAKWLSVITYNINGGTGTTPDRDTVNTGSIILPDDSEFSRSGFIFGGWNTNSFGTGTNYNASTSFTPTNDITLYAIWILRYTVVTFNINGGTGTTPNARTVNAGDSVMLGWQEWWFTRGHFTFGGWNTEPDGSGTNYNANSFFTPNASITLYAKWFTVVNYDINRNGGTGTTPVSDTVIAGNSITLPNDNEFSRGDFTFVGWNNDFNGGVPIYSAGSSFIPTRNTWFYAIWTATVTFDLNGGTGTTPTALTVNAGNNAWIEREREITRDGFIYDGWDTKPDGTGICYGCYDGQPTPTIGLNSILRPDGDITLYARWIPVTLIIDLNGGTGNSSLMEMVIYPDGYENGRNCIGPRSLGHPTRSGFTFDGWNTEPDGTGTNVGPVVCFNSNMTLYARWIPHYTVNFDLNGGTGTTPATQTGSDVWLAPNWLFSNGNFAFGGWNTKSDGTGTNYNMSTSFTPTSSITLYARWFAVVTYDINGGTGTTPIRDTVIAGNSVALPSSDGFSRSQFTFADWNTNSFGTGTNYNADSPLIPTGNITLFARWTTVISVLSPDRVIPPCNNSGETGVAAPVNTLSGEFTVGPNPVNKQSGAVNFFWQGKWVQSATLTIFDASGNVVNKIRITDNALNIQERREVGSWDLKDAKGRSVAEGTYLVRGVVTTSDGKKERVSVMLGIR